MFREITDSSIAMKKNESYPYNMFRYPSIGMLACPADVPAELFGMQLAFSFGNNLPFINWGVPNMTLKTAILDMTNSDYNMIRIRQGLEKYYQKLATEAAGEDGDITPKVDLPTLYGIDLVIQKNGRIEGQAEQDFLDYLANTVNEGYNFIYIHGMSGYFDKSFYDCVSRMKKMTVEKNTCMILNHVIASVVYSKDDAALRGPLSYSMIRETHQEAAAIFDWTWFVAPTTIQMIKNVSGQDVDKAPAGSSLFANKVVHPNRFLELGKRKDNDECPAKGLFYIYKGTSPILFPVKLIAPK